MPSPQAHPFYNTTLTTVTEGKGDVGLTSVAMEQLDVDPSQTPSQLGPLPKRPKTEQPMAPDLSSHLLEDVSFQAGPGPRHTGRATAGAPCSIDKQGDLIL